MNKIETARFLRERLEKKMKKTAESFSELDMTLQLLDRYIAGETLKRDEKSILDDLLKNYKQSKVFA